MSAHGSDNRLREHPSAERNKGPILEVLRRVLPPAGTVLEIASGTGQHVVYFAEALPHLVFQPSDPDPASRASVAAWIAETGLSNVRPPLDLVVHVFAEERRSFYGLERLWGDAPRETVPDEGQGSDVALLAEPSDRKKK